MVSTEKIFHLEIKNIENFVFVLADALHHSQQLFSHVRMILGLKQY